MTTKIINGKLVYNRAVILRNAHITAKANAVYLGINYRVALAASLKLEWQIARQERSTYSISDGGLRIQVSPLGYTKKTHELRSAF